jgi:hypothetical protein
MSDHRNCYRGYHTTVYVIDLNKTGTKGVYKHEGGYAVSICGHYIGWFKNLQDAVNARKNSEMEVLSGARD